MPIQAVKSVLSPALPCAVLSLCCAVDPGSAGYSLVLPAARAEPHATCHMPHATSSVSSTRIPTCQRAMREIDWPFSVVLQT
jgi:hypothetical protein